MFGDTGAYTRVPLPETIEDVFVRAKQVETNRPVRVHTVEYRACAGDDENIAKL